MKIFSSASDIKTSVCSTSCCDLCVFTSIISVSLTRCHESGGRLTSSGSWGWMGGGKCLLVICWRLHKPPHSFSPLSNLTPSHLLPGCFSLLNLFFFSNHSLLCFYKFSPAPLGQNYLHSLFIASTCPDVFTDLPMTCIIYYNWSSIIIHLWANLCMCWSLLLQQSVFPYSCFKGAMCKKFDDPDDPKRNLAINHLTNPTFHVYF